MGRILPDVVPGGMFPPGNIKESIMTNTTQDRKSQTAQQKPSQQQQRQDGMRNPSPDRSRDSERR